MPERAKIAMKLSTRVGENFRNYISMIARTRTFQGRLIKKNGKIQDFPGQSQKSRIVQDSGHHVSYFLHIINTVFINHNSKFGEI